MKAKYPTKLANKIVMEEYTHNDVLAFITKTKGGYEHSAWIIDQQESVIEELKSQVERLKSGRR